MKVLVTGGCGFLGSNIAASYLNSGDTVVVIDALFRQGGESNLEWLRSKATGARFTHHKFDLADREAVEGVFKNHGPFDYVCHLGGQVAMTTSLENPHRDFMTNALGTLNVLEAVRRYSPHAFVAYSSTNKVYGDLEYLEYAEGPARFSLPAFKNGLDESTPLDFASPYGCSKGSADQYVRDWHRNFGVKTVVFRHSSIFGGRQFSTFDQGWIGWFCKQAIDQKKARESGTPVAPFTIAGTGKQVRDVLHADDLIALYRTAYEKRDSVAGEVFNIGGGIDNSLSLLELFSLLEELLKHPTPLVYAKMPRRQSDQDFFVADIGKAARLLGWTPKVGKRAGVSRMLGWLDGTPVS